MKIVTAASDQKSENGAKTTASPGIQAGCRPVRPPAATDNEERTTDNKQQLPASYSSQR
jgi:hypothetical protein